MSEATQTPATKGSNGALLQGMTSNPAEQGKDANKADAPSADPAGKPASASPSTHEGVTKSHSPKKRRKVNHACIYCRRSHMTCDLERPCTRCIKRDIGHLCRDEPRDPAKKHKPDAEGANGESSAPKLDSPAADATITSLDQRTGSRGTGLNLAPPALPQDGLASTAAIVQPSPVSAPQVPALGNTSQSFLNYDDWNLASSFQDMHNLHPSYMFNTSEVHNEYNLLNDFLSNSLMDDGHLYAGDDIHTLISDPSLTNTMASLPGAQSMLPPSSIQLPPPQTAAGNSIPRPASGFPQDKAREKYYMAAADPAGNDTPEERMNKLLKAKYDAGLLKPFNYVRGYARLNQYMEKHLQQSSRMKILRQLDRFRPKFRERMQSLSDVELVRVEMWFERSLMEYDRLFASMAIPACCWRRTGEIFRGNKEFAELIHVPMEQMRDGKLAIHEIIAEGSLVSYWEKFGAIAFDNSQKAILTSCSLRNPDINSKDPEIRCCFSFTIRRDPHNIPSLIVGNFLPILPPNT